MGGRMRCVATRFLALRPRWMRCSLTAAYMRSRSSRLPRTTERAARTILTVRAAPWRASPAKTDRRPASEVNAATRGSADRAVETLGPRGARYASRIARTPAASLALAT